MTPEDGLVKWHPACNRVKVNTDAELFENPDRYSYAFIARNHEGELVRNHEGELVEARSKCCASIVTPVLAEEMGVREVLSWIKMKQQCNVDIETDSLELVQWLCSP